MSARDEEEQHWKSCTLDTVHNFHFGSKEGESSQLLQSSLEGTVFISQLQLKLTSNHSTQSQFQLKHIKSLNIKILTISHNNLFETTY
jgi:hypothetical protein